MWISPAYAQAAGGGGGMDLMTSLLPLVLIFAVFWFFLIRPQQTKMKQHREMVAALKRGDQIVTGGGIFGKVTKVVDDNVVQVEIADGVRVRVVKGTVTDVVSRTEPVRESKKDNDNEQSGEGAKSKRSMFGFGPKK